MRKPITSTQLFLYVCVLLFSGNVFSEEPATEPATTPANSETTQTTTPVETAAPTAEPAPPTPAAPPPEKDKRILRALLTTGIVNREPSDEVVALDKNLGRIYFFTEFADMKGQVVKHRWEYQGKIMAEVNFNVSGSPWRCYSSKNIQPEWTGIWTVSAVDNNGKVIGESYFEVTD